MLHCKYGYDNNALGALQSELQYLAWGIEI